jgi:hypothetical protein
VGSCGVVFVISFGVFFSCLKNSQQKIMLLIAVFLVVASASINNKSLNIRRLGVSANPINPMSHFECSACISFINEALNDLIQIIAQVGIGGGCSKVCGLLPSSTLATICDIGILILDC